MTRIALWIFTNLAIIIVASVVMRILGVNPQTMSGLLIFCALFGFGGSFISLMLSKWMAKRSMKCRVIEQPNDSTERWLVETVANQAQRAGIAMPEVAIFDSEDMNAFADHIKSVGYEFSDGPTESSSGSTFAFVDAPEGYEVEIIQKPK